MQQPGGGVGLAGATHPGPGLAAPTARAARGAPDDRGPPELTLCAGHQHNDAACTSPACDTRLGSSKPTLGCIKDLGQEPLYGVHGYAFWRRPPLHSTRVVVTDTAGRSSTAQQLTADNVTVWLTYLQAPVAQVTAYDAAGTSHQLLPPSTTRPSGGDPPPAR